MKESVHASEKRGKSSKSMSGSRSARDEERVRERACESWERAGRCWRSRTSDRKAASARAREGVKRLRAREWIDGSAKHRYERKKGREVTSAKRESGKVKEVKRVEEGERAEWRRRRRASDTESSASLRRKTSERANEAAMSELASML
eukprot:5444102-Pleurochrysis_carterae.AAC.3